MPNEEIQYKFDLKKFVVNDEKYSELVITNKRLICYKRSGLILKKDNMLSMNLRQIDGIKFKEVGIVRKKGVVEILGSIKWTIKSSRENAKVLYNFLIEKLPLSEPIKH